MFLPVWFLFSLGLCSARFPEEENENADGSLFGGDMRLTNEQRLLIEMGGDISLAGHVASGRAAMSNVSILWLPNNKVVPWTITKQLEDTAEATFGLMGAFREWEERSCLSFKRRTNEKDYVEFFQGSGCWSYVGRQGGAQNISLANGCWGVGTIVHEIGHAMGFGHEQNRPDRDQYINVRWENIPQRKKHNFDKYTDSKVDSMNSVYDYKSFMQYSKTAFGFNNSITLDPSKPNIFQLGQRVGFTADDQFQAMTLYKCQKTTRPTTVPVSYELKGDITCDFETDMCGFSQDNTDDFDWSQRYGGTPSGSTGPDSDHTTGRLGTFLYCEMSPPRKENDVARLKTKAYDLPPTDQCFEFFYSMYAKDATMMGKFNVYYNDLKTVNKKVFSRSASEDNNEWKKVSLDLNPKGQFYLTFEAIRGSGYQGDIAIDDISITKGACKPKPITQNKTKTTDPSKSCEDTQDRERQYCTQWEQAGYCIQYEKSMRQFCQKTCKFC